ncbi:MAG: CRISPR-associated endonuclease Cas1 [bacterium]|nr:CRISPR-associated endonuclease Cas1 [bacterium]
MLNEFVYCPRLFFYEWVERVFVESVDTVEGSQRHEKLERKADPLPPAGDGDDRPVRSRSVSVASDELKLIAVIDVVEGSGSRVTPVDYKKGRPRDGIDGPEPWDADRIQVGAQALILRANGYECDEAVLYYDGTRQRVRVRIDEQLEADVRAAAAAARSVASRGAIPPPLVDSPKCPRCSLVPVCLPDETAAAARLRELDHAEQLPLFDVAGVSGGDIHQASSDPVRRLVPARDDLRPLYVTGHGLSIGKSGEVLQVRERGKLVQEARVGEISQVNVFGNVQLTAAAVQGLCWADRPIAHFSFGGWFYGLTQGIGLKNVFLRREQFRRSEDGRFALRIARAIVASKIRNQRTLLQRNHIEPPALVLKRMRRLAADAGEAEDLAELLGIEGTAARMYFQEFGGLLKQEDGDGLPPLDLDGRNRRPPRDPVNALLSFAYSLLVKDVTIVCATIGFDPFVGFYHQPRFGRPALALDMMEMFRPLIADSAVLSAINTRMVGRDDFIQAGRAVGLTPSGRKGMIRAYEQRIDTLVTHPLFGYRVSYRRILEIQARLLARVLMGEIVTYPGFETR